MLNWGIIGAGGIAQVFCNAMRLSKTGRVVAVSSRDGEGAKRLSNMFSIPKWYGGYEKLLMDEEVDVVYISTIHPTHAEWSIKAAQAGKHILVEKPIGINYVQAAAMIEAANKTDVFLMEAFMYRCHPQTQKLVDLVSDGKIGEVRMIRAVLSFRAPFKPTSRLFSKELGGGGILDVGCYPASITRQVAGVVEGKTFLDPLEVKACGKLGPTGVDHYAAAVLEFENGIIAEIICGVECEMPHEVSIYGSKGMLALKNPWLPSSPCRFAEEPVPLDTIIPPAKIELLHNGSHKPEEIVIEADRDLYTYEADAVAENINKRQPPFMSWDDTLSNMILLDRWRKEVGLVYEADSS